MEAAGSRGHTTALQPGQPSKCEPLFSSTRALWRAPLLLSHHLGSPQIPQAPEGCLCPKHPTLAPFSSLPACSVLVGAGWGRGWPLNPLGAWRGQSPEPKAQSMAPGLSVAEPPALERTASRMGTASFYSRGASEPSPQLPPSSCERPTAAGG